MNSSPKITRIRMPSDESLFPAHVVAIRPDIEGQSVQRGDYILSVETPRGTRNVMAPNDGIVSIQVSLLQDIEPGSQMFCVAQSEPIPDVSAPDHKRVAPSSAQANSQSKGQSTGAISRWIKLVLFWLIILALAILLYGLVFGILGKKIELNLATGIVMSSAVLGLLFLTWLASKLPGLSGTVRSIPSSIAAVLLFAIALVAGSMVPSLQRVVLQTTNPATQLVSPSFKSLLTTLGVKTINSSQEPQVVIELPNVDSTVRSAADPLLGDIILVGFNFCPRGWAAADGQLLPISPNQELYSIFGKTYGGDGRTTFALPDMRGRAPVHAGAGPTFDNKLLGQKINDEKIQTTAGQHFITTGPPYLAMNYCISMRGRLPPKS